MEKNQQVECTLFPSAFEIHRSAVCTLEQYIKAVRNGKYQTLVAQVRALRAAGDKEQANAVKRTLPVLVAGGVMEGGRKLTNLVRYSGCVTLDLDDVPGNPVEWLQRAEQLSYTKAGHVSPSGTGVKLFVLVGTPMEQHREMFEQLARRVEEELPGIKVDRSGKDPNRGCFAGCDPHAFYKEEAEVLAAELFSPIRPSRQAGESSPLLRYIVRFEEANHFLDGSRHTYLVKLAAALNSAGFDEHEVTDECLRRYVEPGFPAKEVREVVADIYARYRSEHGVSLKSRKNLTPVPENQPAEEGDELGADIEADSVVLPTFSKAVFDQLPSLLADAVRPAEDEVEQDLMTLAALTICSTALPGVQGNMNGDRYAPPFYTLLIGPSGSGKGCINGMRGMVQPWQTYVEDNSRHAVKKYKEEKEAYDDYRFRERHGKKQTHVGPPPAEPKEVKQRQLHISGYTTTARLIELLQVNGHYTSFLFESELESVNNTLAQDFGGYAYILNEAFHHETVSCSSKTNGSFLVHRPYLGMLATGTPGMLDKLVPSTESGLFSRLLIYRITQHNDYRPLSDSDSTYSRQQHYAKLGQRLLDIAVHLDENPTFVYFSEKQRKRLDRYFKREYNNVRAFGNEDIASVVLRHRLIIFRMGMTLTAIRKGESGSTERRIEMSDVDFEIAFTIGTCTLRHSMLVSTGMKRAGREKKYKIPTAQLDLFAALPDEFTTAEALSQASVRGIKRATLFRILEKVKKFGLVISLERGCYRKTQEGKEVQGSK